MQDIRLPLKDPQDHILRQAVNNLRDTKEIPERLYLLIVGALIIVYSLAPFDFSFSTNGFKSRVNEAIVNSFSEGLLAMAGHFMGFAILGGLIAAMKEGSSQWHGFGCFVLVAIVFCTGLEISQLLLPTRHASLTDLLCNIGGVLVGAWSSIRWQQVRTVRLALQEHRDQYRSHVQTGIFILASMVWVVSGLLPIVGVLRMEWSKDFHLLIGNEFDGSRPWFGILSSVVRPTRGRGETTGAATPPPGDSVVNK